MRRCSPKEFKKNDDGSITVVYSTPDGGTAEKTFDQVLMATGRGPNTTNLGLEDAGVKTNKAGCAPCLGPDSLACEAAPTLICARFVLLMQLKGSRGVRRDGRMN